MFFYVNLETGGGVRAAPRGGRGGDSHRGALALIELFATGQNRWYTGSIPTRLAALRFYKEEKR